MSILSPHEAVQALVAAKWSESRIAKAAGTSQPTIHRLKRGTQRTVAFEVGAELIRLACGVAAEAEQEQGAA